MLCNDDFHSSLLCFTSSISCSFCKELVRRPYLLSKCNHLLCEDCLFTNTLDDGDGDDTQMISSFPTNCPVCKEKITEKELTMNETIVTLVACVKKLNNIPISTIKKVRRALPQVQQPSSSSQKINVESLRIRSSSPPQSNPFIINGKHDVNDDVMDNIDLDSTSQESHIDSNTQKKSQNKQEHEQQSEQLFSQTLEHLSKEEQEQQSEAKKIKTSTITIATTGLDGDCKDIILSSAKHITGAKCFIRNEYQTNRITHLICHVNEETGRVRRTIKYMRAFLDGVKIVSYAWFLASLTCGEWRDEEEFLIKGDDVYLEGEWVTRNPYLFKGLLIFLKGSYKKPSPTKLDIQHLISSGGGKEIRYDPSNTGPRTTTTTTRNKDPPEVIIIKEGGGGGAEGAGEFREEFQRKDISYLFDCISAMKIL